MSTRKIIGLVFCAMLFNLLSAQDCKPDFTGFYYFRMNDQNSAVLRFFANGEVIATTSSNKYEEVENYFTLEKKDLMLHGKYKWKKCSSSFHVKGDTGEQYYQVEKKGEELFVTIKDKASGKSTSRTYSFYNIKK